MAILLVNNQKKYHVGIRGLKVLAEKSLKALGVPEGLSLSVNFVDKNCIRRLNKIYFKKDKPTDVIALGYKDKKRSCRRCDWGHMYLGDIIICPDIAMKNTVTYNESFEHEIAFYMLHGILHLLGFSDSDNAEREKMHKKQKEILGKVWKRPKAKP
jgi:probable rRNA maturation factor